FVSHALGLALLPLIFHVVKELIPFRGFHLTLPFSMHTLFHNHIWLQTPPFLVLSCLSLHLFLAFHLVLCHELLIPFFYTLFYTSFVLSYFLILSAHSFYTF